MEHEIADHTKKALRAIKDHDKSLWGKTKEIILEVLIIVFAVTFAAFIERTREHYKEKAEAKEFVVGLKGDIANAISTLKTSESDIDSMRSSYSFLAQLKSSSIDSVVKATKHSNFSISKFDTHLTNGRYDGFKSSGKIQTIEDDSLRNNILKFYEEDVPFVDFSEGVFNANQVRLEDYVLNNANNGSQTLKGLLTLLTTYKCRMIFTFSLGYSDAVLKGYSAALKQAEKVQAEIDKVYP
jgi:hypothetical protein